MDMNIGIRIYLLPDEDKDRSKVVYSLDLEMRIDQKLYIH